MLQRGSFTFTVGSPCRCLGAASPGEHARGRIAVEAEQIIAHRTDLRLGFGQHREQRPDRLGQPRGT